MENANITPIRELRSFFLITIVFTWTFWWFAIPISTDGVDTGILAAVLVVLGAHGPLVASFGLTYRRGGWPAARQLLADGFRFRMPLRWWIVILTLPLIVAGAAFGLAHSFGGVSVDTPLLEQWWIIPGVMIYLHLLGGSVQEEFGWRGFALPKLLDRFSPFSSSLILGAIWGIWHLPLFYISGVGQEYWSFAVFLPLTLTFSLVFTWIYLRTNRNLFSALLLHTMINTSFNVFPPVEQIENGSQAGTVSLLILYVFVAVVIIARERSLFFGTVQRTASTGRLPSGPQKAR